MKLRVPSEKHVHLNPLYSVHSMVGYQDRCFLLRTIVLFLVLFTIFISVSLIQADADAAPKRLRSCICALIQEGGSVPKDAGNSALAESHVNRDFF